MFEIHYQGQVTVNHGIFYSTFAEIETQGNVILDGAGYSSASGPGAGSSSPGGYGSGGGYGGQGGTSYLNHPGGHAYGSVFKPLALGSGGGSVNVMGGSGENYPHFIMYCGGILEADANTLLLFFNYKMTLFEFASYKVT